MPTRIALRAILVGLRLSLEARISIAVPPRSTPTAPTSSTAQPAQLEGLADTSWIHLLCRKQ